MFFPVDRESLTEATSGAIGALVSTIVLYPLDTCKTKLQAEVSRVKSDDANADFGVKDSVRIDVLECPETRTTCVYDIKTGVSRSSGLSPRRMRELASHAFTACPGAERVIVTEVRPGQ